jgi:hypothetical protein
VCNFEVDVKRVAETIQGITSVAAHVGLSINVSKTKYITNRKKKENKPEETEIYGQT